MNTRALLVAVASIAALAPGCGDEQTTSAESTGSGSTTSSTGASTSTSRGGGAGGASSSTSSPASSSSTSSSGSSSSSSGQGGAGGGDDCTGKACGSGCITEAGEGMCDPGGSCVVTSVQCAGYTPCLGVGCGKPCSSCDPVDPTCEPAPGTVCDITAICIYPPPACD